MSVKFDVGTVYVTTTLVASFGPRFFSALVMVSGPTVRTGLLSVTLNSARSAAAWMITASDLELFAGTGSGRSLLAPAVTEYVPGVAEVSVKLTGLDPSAAIVPRAHRTFVPDCVQLPGSPDAVRPLGTAMFNEACVAALLLLLFVTW